MFLDIVLWCGFFMCQTLKKIIYYPLKPVFRSSQVYVKQLNQRQLIGAWASCL